MSELYAANTPARFWGTGTHVSDAAWLAAAREASACLPGGQAVLDRAGWPGLAEYVLGEGQFGPRHFRLNLVRRLYYELRPYLPRRITAVARRAGQHDAAKAFRLNWPIEDRFVHFLYALRDRVTAHTAAPTLPFWPDAAPFAFVLTHDVERADGQRFVDTVARLDEQYGFRSAFNFVPEDYQVDLGLVADLHARGFEVGLHGLKHDGKLFSSRSGFLRAAPRVGQHARRLGSVGFRSPATHRNPAWMQALEIEYDSSFFDTDPYEVMPGGTMSIWPFFIGHFVELPYTLAQDNTLVTVLGERTPRVWIEKIEFIARWGGMALLNAHPDYLRSEACWRVYEALLEHMAELQARSQYWHALPCDVARWWRRRADMAA